MSQKHRRSNRGRRSPANKAKVVFSTSPFASANSDPAKAIAAKRK